MRLPSLCIMNHHYSFYSLEYFFKSVSEIGYQFAEIWTSPQHFYMDYNGFENPDILKKLEEKYQLKIIGICPEQTNPKPNNMAAKSPEMQKRVLSYFKNAIDLAKAVDAKQVVVTSGWAYYDEPKNNAYKRSVDMLKNVSEYAEKKGMNLAIEALQKDESLLANSVIELSELVQEVNCPSLNICLDTGAMVKAGNSIQDYFDYFGKKVVHSHFVDVDDSVTHLALGDGNCDIKSEIKHLNQNNYAGYLSVEVAEKRYFKNPVLADKKSFQVYQKATGKG